MRRFADRIKAILLLDNGWAYEEVAEALFLDDATIRRYHKAYKDEGVNGLVKVLVKPIQSSKRRLSRLTRLSKRDLARTIRSTLPTLAIPSIAPLPAMVG